MLLGHFTGNAKMRICLSSVCSATVAVALAGSARAGVVPAVLDPLTVDLKGATLTVPPAGGGLDGNGVFSTTDVGGVGQASQSDLVYSDGVSVPFAYRYANVQGTGLDGTSTSLSGAVTLAVHATTRSWTATGTGNFSAFMKWANDESSAVPTDLSSWTHGFAFRYSVAANTQLAVGIEWGQGELNGLIVTPTSSSGWLAFQWTDFDAGSGVDSSQIRSITIGIGSIDGAETSNFGGTISNIIPGPGAAALVGLAGLMSRRRRN